MRTDEPAAEHVAAPADRALAAAENVTYILVGLVLIVGAALALINVGYHLVTDLSDGTELAVIEAVDGLLLVFILLELIAGVRETMVERKLVAEPFLVAGIIASIKEIILLALEARAEGSDQDAFDNAMVEIGVLAVVVVLLSVAGWLVRRKEREPTEGGT